MRELLRYEQDQVAGGARNSLGTSAVKNPAPLASAAPAARWRIGSYSPVYLFEKPKPFYGYDVVRESA